jgi:NAD(P)-dependent dehydrogenase (short-subunit alcohol dehydrogenase family)
VGIVTGGARGVGLAVAQTLSLHGASVIIVDNGCAVDGESEDSGACEAAAERCKGVALAASVADPATAEQAVELAVSKFGAVDILVNAATITRDATLHATRSDDLQRVWQTVVVGNFLMTAAVSRQMKTQALVGRTPGSIINLMAAAGLHGRSAGLASSTLNAALFGMTRATAFDLAPDRITCNAVVPFADTRSTRLASIGVDDADAGWALYQTRNQQLGPSFPANLVAWLATSAAHRVTGQVFGVRGRELWLVAQPRPSDSMFTGAGVMDPEEMTDLVFEKLSAWFTPLQADWEVFNSEPIL